MCSAWRKDDCRKLNGKGRSCCYTISSTIGHDLHNVFNTKQLNSFLDLISNVTSFFLFPGRVSAINEHRSIRRNCQEVYYWAILHIRPPITDKCCASYCHLSLELGQLVVDAGHSFLQ
jgi:hypothetical protein